MLSRLKYILILVAVMATTVVSAKKHPQITFEETTIDMGQISLQDPIRVVEFKFTNSGKAKLVINNVHASCGCTVAEYPKDYIAPGATGVIRVTYNATGKMPGRFKKNVQIFSNAKPEMTRIFIQGEHVDVPVSKK